MATPAQPTHDTVTPNARTLRGLAHPVRVQLLGLLRLDGPSTATKLGERLRLSSAATSYHLRQLATYGFIVDVDGDSSGRERWWQAAHRVTTFGLTPSDDPDLAEVGEAYLRGVLQVYASNVSRYLDERATLPASWQGAGTLSDLVLRLTAAETEELVATLWQLVEHSRRADQDPAEAPDGARRVSVQLQVFPRVEDDR